MTHRIVFFDFETAGLEPTHELIQLGAHDALADARMCVKLAQRLQHGMSLLGAPSV